MEQLNTQIKINDIRLQNNNLKFKSCGYLDIKYFGNEINNKNEIDLTVEITKEIESLNLDLNLNFTYVSECSRCLDRNNKDDSASFNKNLSTNSENDYDIYIMTTRGQLSEEIRHAVPARLKPLPRRIYRLPPLPPTSLSGRLVRGSNGLQISVWQKEALGHRSWP